MGADIPVGLQQGERSLPTNPSAVLALTKSQTERVVTSSTCRDPFSSAFVKHGFYRRKISRILAKALKPIWCRRCSMSSGTQFSRIRPSWWR